MHTLSLLAGLAAILLALIDAFETILQPRRVTHRFRYAQLYYRHTWQLWRLASHLTPTRKLRESLLSTYGPLSLLGLFITWILLLILGFAALDWGANLPLAGNSHGLFTDYLYMSGTTFFTLGYGDITPNSTPGRFLAVAESGMGFAFLACVIGYLPILYQAASRRELVIALMDARAGSPPTAAEVLLRHARNKRLDRIDDLLQTWERWAAELLESHLSFPVLSYYRSQHDNQSWLATLATILDTCSLLLADIKPDDLYQVQTTFATARHAAVDLALILKIPPIKLPANRLNPDQLQQLRHDLHSQGITLRQPDPARLAELRNMYEPFLEALSHRLLFPLPPFIPTPPIIDNWQRSSLGRAPSLSNLTPDNDHF